MGGTAGEEKEESESPVCYTFAMVTAPETACAPYDAAVLVSFFFCYGCVSRAASSAQYASKAVCSVAEAK